MISAIINGNAPASPETIKRLKSFRQTLEPSQTDLFFVRVPPGIHPRIVAAISEMEKHFPGSWGETRRRICAEMAAPARADHCRRYHLTGQEWFAASTAAIDAIRKVSESYSMMATTRPEVRPGSSSSRPSASRACPWSCWPSTS
jgi:hypothetical protein